MRIAIFHDYFGAIGGGERLVLTLAREFKADIITTDIDRDSISKMGFDDVTMISLGQVVTIAPLKQIHASFKFALCKFPHYDFYLFSGNWAHYASYHHHPNLWYCHTPVRAFYDLKSYVIQNQKSVLHRIFASTWIFFHSYYDQKSVNRIDSIVTNSENTQHRIDLYYGRDADVVYPPVETGRFSGKFPGEYWLSVNRLYPEKRIPLQIHAFSKLPDETLKIVGWYSEGDHAKKSLDYLNDIPENIEILGSVSDTELVSLYNNCKGLLCTAMDEDFGMTPLEAMAAGKPVIAVNEGGYRESIINGITGRLIDAESSAIVEAIKEIESDGFERYLIPCRMRAKEFDISVFTRKMRDQIFNIFEQSRKGKRC